MGAVTKYSVLLYDLLAKETKLEIIQDVEVPIFRGSLTKLWEQTGGSNAYYSKVMRNLTDLGCISVLQRGAGRMESVVAIIRRPDGEEISPAGLTRRPRPDTLVADVENIKRNLGGIDIVEAFKDVETRLLSLEREVRDFGKESSTTASN
jgi:hypothetical protein